MVQNIPAGNILLSAAIYLNGASFKKINRVFDSMNVQTVCTRTHYSHMNSFLQPAIYSYWKDKQRQLFEMHMSLGGSLTLGGDMRADSPGHCAKYGCYTMMDLQAGRVIDIQLIQVKYALLICFNKSKCNVLTIRYLMKKKLLINFEP